MRIFSKIKELFLEDEDVDKTADYTKEIKVEPTAEKEKEEKTLTEGELYKSPSTFKFPVIFEEEDLKPSVEEKRHYPVDRSKVKTKKNEEEEHKFVPSPIISPVYGILDKNYAKDQITNKSDQPDYESKRKYNKVDIDVIRQKAFGTLEDDLEQTILEDRGFIYGIKEEKEPKEEIDPIALEMGLEQEEKEDVTLEEAYENYSDYGVEYNAETHIEEALQKTEVLEDDLFELINTMYKEEEEK